MVYPAGLEYSNVLENCLVAQGSLPRHQAAHIAHIELRVDHLVNSPTPTEVGSTVRPIAVSLAQGHRANKGWGQESLSTGGLQAGESIIRRRGFKPKVNGF